MLRLVLV